MPGSDAPPPEQVEQSFFEKITPALAGLSALGLGYGVGRSSEGDPNIFTQPLQTMSLLDYRRNLGSHYANMDAQQRLAQQQHLAELSLKQNQQQYKFWIDNELRRELGLPEVPMANPGSPMMQSIGAPPLANQGQSTQQSVVGTPPSLGYSSWGLMGGAADQAPQNIPQSLGIGQQGGPSSRGYQKTIKLTPNEGFSAEWKQQEPLDALGKSVQDYTLWLQQTPTNTPHFRAMDQAFRARIAEMSRVQYTDPRSQLFEDARLIHSVMGNTPAADMLVDDLQQQYDRVIRHGGNDSPVGKMLKDRSYYAEGTPEYDMFTNAIRKETMGQMTDQGITLSSAYIRNSSDFLTVKDNFLQLAEAFNDSLVNPGNAVNDSSMIFGYMKMVDPTSVVREGEYDRANNWAGVPKWLLNYFAPDGKLIEGVALPPDVRYKLMQGATTVYEGRLPGQMLKETMYQTMARNMGIPPEYIVSISGRPMTKEQGIDYLSRARGNQYIAEAMAVSQGYNPATIPRMQQVTNQPVGITNNKPRR